MFSRFILSCLVFIVAVGVSAQSLSDKFYESLMNKEYESADSLLAQWRDNAPSDPELFAARFNYFLNMSRNEMMVITGDTVARNESLVLQDSTGAVAGLIASEVTWDNRLFSKAIATIDEGINKHPRRLDFRFGKAKAFEMRGLFDQELAVLDDVIDCSADTSCKWTWTGNEPLDSHNIIPDAIFDYCVVFYNNEANEELKKLCSKYTQTIRPDVRILNIWAATCFDEGNYPDALNIFMQAHEADPDDMLILCNIAYLYLQMGDRDKAAQTYRQVIDNPNADPDSRAIAQEMLTTHPR